ncbi:GTP-binding protein HSR1-related protein [Thalassoporum mexicanum PCC 7367]|uniref:YcjF family protein n=1 Tax=Thalassoporum mexicanum TaxID=3457544 RepID=UPI00029FCC35|nr:GTPase [Pseudanabaena sp. PCC 7367]AFY68475.1 GTP-binding protein HSR1-related protein [Pseudanabaena sp. PCC 7367]
MSDDDFSLADIIKLIETASTQAEADMGQCNILVIGKTGVGKSTLVNAIFREELTETGTGRPITQHIRQYYKDGYPVTIYDTPGLELSPQQMEQTQLDVSHLIDELRLESADRHIHVIWYCLNHESGRIEDVEADWLQLLSEIKDVPTVLVLTQTLTRKQSEFQTYLKSRNLPVNQIVPLLAKSKLINDEYEVKAHGLDRLVEVTLARLPEEAKKAFVREQITNIKLKANTALKYVGGYVTGAAGVGASPIPFSDAIALVPLQAAMLANINVIFGLQFDRAVMATILSGIGGTAGVTFAGRAIVANLLKLIPAAGTVAGAAISSTTAAALTFAMGLAYIELLKKVARAKLAGRQISNEQLRDTFADLYGKYARSGRRNLDQEEDDWGDDWEF